MCIVEYTRKLNHLLYKQVRKFKKKLEAFPQY